MIRALVCSLAFFVWIPAALAEESAKAEEKVVSGMSIVGNDEAPKSLVIVPWKSSAMGHTLDVSRVLDDGRRPVDREVFLREIDYYEIRAEQRTIDVGHEY